MTAGALEVGASAGALAAGSLAEGSAERLMLGSVVGKVTDPLPEHAARTAITTRVANALTRAGMRLMADCPRTTYGAGVTRAG